MTSNTTSSAHTPGPWQVNPTRDGKLAVLGSCNAEWQRIICVTNSKKNDEDEVNVRLIAAAPELLQRLIELVTDLKGAKELMLSAAESDSWMLTADGWDSLIDGTNAVIAKAAGRTYEYSSPNVR